MVAKRIYLSPPHMSGWEQQFVQDAFDTNWIAPLGPHVNAFEEEFCEVVGSAHAAALSSGTAALHLAMILQGIEPGDEVLVSDLTFSASVNPIIYCGGKPVFIDSETASWNLDPNLLEDALKKKAAAGNLPKAMIIVHLYGQAADMEAICALSEQYGVPIIEDAAEALGATHHGRAPGTLGRMGIYSFNGNKIITTSGGGMLVSDDKALIDQARKLATQARDPAPHYQHSQIGYNYRLSNILAGVGRGQLRVLSDRVQTRRQNFDFYCNNLGHLPGISFMPEAPWGRSNRWLTVMQVNPELSGSDREQIRLALEEENIESRPVWKPMHLQPIYAQYEVFGGHVSEHLFERGLCLPSGSSLTKSDLNRIVYLIRSIVCT
ncbi:MAG: aminotransferase class I/II-fold pyridoxal phosphate-dependent enzyme [Ardenticatenaceae bacterium]|nr:aminotransferase class I/II-fold pyridoxal phosphate-dependent enzyme [Ardenticatenaceae bacterium]